jgi:hypothetical protein
MTALNIYNYISSIPKFLGLSIIILLAGVRITKAQNNTNSMNGNVANLNVNANREDNGNANVNTNVNLNTNTNRNTNGNTNANTITGQNNNSDSNSNDYFKQLAETRKGVLANSYWFFTIVTLMFGAVLIPFVYIIVRAIKFSSGTYGPLGMPEGSIRAILAYMLLAFLGFYILTSVLSVTDFKPPEFLLGVVATVIGFYFGSRTGEDKGTGTRITGAVEGNVTDKTGASAGGADVELSQSDGKKLTQKADANGKYKFENVPAGDYDIKASLTGHQSSVPAKLKIKAGGTQTMNLRLQ